MLLHITSSHVAMIKYHMHYPIFMACIRVQLDVIFVYSLNQVCYQAISPMNGLEKMA